MRQRDWRPWDEYKVALEVIKDIKEPPCKYCSNFGLKRKYNGTIYDGVVLCHAIMEKDFSCFRAKVQR